MCFLSPWRCETEGLRSAGEHYGVHLMKAMQKVNMNKLRADHATKVSMSRRSTVM